MKLKLCEFCRQFVEFCWPLWVLSAIFPNLRTIARNEIKIDYASRTLPFWPDISINEGAIKRHLIWTRTFRRLITLHTLFAASGKFFENYPHFASLFDISFSFISLDEPSQVSCIDNGIFVSDSIKNLKILLWELISMLDVILALHICSMILALL